MKKLRSWKFVSAVVFLLAAVSFRISDDGAQWMWTDTPVVGVVLALVSLVFWGLFVREAMSGPREGQ